MERPLSIAQVNASAGGGGAESVARQLLQGFRRRGHDTSLLVGRGEASGTGVRPFPNDRVARMAHALAGPLRLVDRQRGLETYHYPSTWKMLDVLPGRPDVVHLHNLHGGYFDLRYLPELSRSLPVVLTLHDAWLLSGHCAHSLGCERWRTGCGACPDLSIYPEVRRDATARNWERKREIFRRSRLHVATPCAWLADMVRASILAPAVEELRVIANGVDLDVFHPGDRKAARSRLGLRAHELIVLFVGTHARTNPFKDLATAERAVAHAATILDKDVSLIVVGTDGSEVGRARAWVRFVPPQEDPAVLARYYQASDVYLHAARADTFPLSVLEALACGTPAVASAVGGVPEQIRTVAPSTPRGNVPAPEGGGATGVLVAPGDAEGMGRAIAALLAREPWREELGRNATRDATVRFNGADQCDAYLGWYRSILGHSRPDAESGPPVGCHDQG
jgi:glycosyltransferase involved in cell wall biosynthesis